MPFKNWKVAFAALVIVAHPVAVSNAPANAAKNADARFTDAQLIDGFMKTVFGNEGSARSSASARYVKKFAGPVRVQIINQSRVNRTSEVRRFVSTLNSTVRNLNIRTVNGAHGANLQVYLVDRANYAEVIQKTLPRNYDTRFLRRMHCSGVVTFSNRFIIKNVQIYIIGSDRQSEFHHCMVEEITQGLGPINDNSSLRYSLYNDYGGAQTYGVFDWFILNMLYDARIKPGMTQRQVSKVLPAAIRDARRRLARMNLPRP